MYVDVLYVFQMTKSTVWLCQSLYTLMDKVIQRALLKRNTWENLVNPLDFGSKKKNKDIYTQKPKQKTCYLYFCEYKNII